MAVVSVGTTPVVPARGARTRIHSILDYCRRNPGLPVGLVLVLLLLAIGIVGGAVLVEYLFAYPGVGYLLYQGIVNNDFTLIQGIVFMLILTTATTVLIVDLIYPLIDPRISYQQR